LTGKSHAECGSSAYGQGFSIRGSLVEEAERKKDADIVYHHSGQYSDCGSTIFVYISAPSRACHCLQNVIAGALLKVLAQHSTTHFQVPFSCCVWFIDARYLFLGRMFFGRNLTRLDHVVVVICVQRRSNCKAETF
jgi:hypothetical protein